MLQTDQRPIDKLIAHYAESHLHPVNEAIHCVCVPAIVFSLLGLVWSLHPLLAVVVSLVSLFYYLRLSQPFALGMLLMTSAMLWAVLAIPPGQLFAVALAVFVLGWIGQFLGHKVEGKKPSFFDDIRYLLIGPLFVLSVLYRRVGIAY